MDERERLRCELVSVLQEYMLAGTTARVQRHASRIYAVWHNAGPILDEETARGVHMLVDIAFDTGLEADREQIKRLLHSLRSS